MILPINGYSDNTPTTHQITSTMILFADIKSDCKGIEVISGYNKAAYVCMYLPITSICTTRAILKAELGQGAKLWHHRR